ncbi:unnamed protein product [Rotaria sp. Silwood1]|nr:unnamed protein product [Rotaria sp. Silwood1]
MIEQCLPLGTQSPYGTLRLSSDASDTLDPPIKFEHYGGYQYSDTHINVFSHRHTFGAGLQDYGEMGIFPVQVDSDNHLQRLISTRNDYRSAFTHERERIKPDFYQVYLDTHRINVELTATKQVDIHRYSFDNIKKKHRIILIDSSYTLPLAACNRSHVHIDSEKNEITGSIFFEGNFSRSFGGMTTYFIITFTN